ncbi:hypothetical protein Dimus_014277 [Dionaea muscipula]
MSRIRKKKENMYFNPPNNILKCIQNFSKLSFISTESKMVGKLYILLTAVCFLLPLDSIFIHLTAVEKLRTYTYPHWGNFGPPDHMIVYPDHMFVYPLMFLLFDFLTVFEVS